MLTDLLFAVTLFLFRLFSAHRAELAQRWYGRGERDLATHLPEQAAVDLRTALGYAPEEWRFQILLAEALSEAGDTDQAYAYFRICGSRSLGMGR